MAWFKPQLDHAAHASSGGLTVHQDFLSGPEDVYSVYPEISRKSLKDTLKKNMSEVHQMNLDKTFCPHEECGLSCRGMRCAAWSPPRADEVGRCILACLTNDHRLTIYREFSKVGQWRKVVELSEIYKDELPPDDIPVICSSLKSLRDVVYARCPMVISWSPVFDSAYESEQPSQEEVKILTQSQETISNCFSILAAGMKNGHVAFWIIRLPCQSRSSCEVVKTISTGLTVCPSSMCWTRCGPRSALLAVGFANGCIKVLKVQDTLHVMVHDVWTECGNMSVSAMCWHVATEGHYILMVGKETFIFAFDMHIGEDEMLLVSRQMHIAGQSDLQISNMSCSGDTIMVCSQDEKIQKLKLLISESAFSISTEIFPLPRDAKRNWIYQGAGISQNALFLAIAASPFQPYFDFKANILFKVQIHQLNYENAALEEMLVDDNSSPSVISDAMLVLKLLISSKAPLPDGIQSLIDNKAEWPTLSARKIKILRHVLLAKKQQQNESTDPQEVSAVDSDVSTVTHLLYAHHVCTCFRNRLSEVCKEPEAHPGPQVISCMLSWLEPKGSLLQTEDTGNLCNRIREKFRQEINVAPTVECQFCGEGFDSLEINKSTCRNGHIFGSCCKSLLPCQGTAYRKCQNCLMTLASAREFIAGVFWLTSSADPNKCTLCDGLLLPVGE